MENDAAVSNEVNFFILTLLIEARGEEVKQKLLLCSKSIFEDTSITIFFFKKKAHNWKIGVFVVREGM